MPFIDYYKILQVDPSAKDEVIVAAYRRLALKYHPDLNSAENATVRMQEINAAYSVLSNPKKRALHDLERSAQMGKGKVPPTPYENKKPERKEQQPFRLKIFVAWWMQLILTIPYALLSTLPAVQVFIYRNDALLAFLVFFGCFAFIVWANAISNIQITENDVTVKVFYGRFRISWNEVESIIVNYPFIALIGNNKRIVLSLTFAGKKKEQMLDYFKQQIEQRKIVLKTNVPFPRTHQNARVRW